MTTTAGQDLGELPPGYRAAELGLADRPRIQAVASWAFATAGLPEEDALRPFPLEPGRIVGVWPQDALDGGQGPALAAMHASYAFTDFGVPGGTLRTAGLTWVSVHPQHRRRGLASAMVRMHLERTARRGEPLSALFASEPGIYGQFGYGRASHYVALTLPRKPEMRPVPHSEAMAVRIEHAELGRHGRLVEAVHAASRRPGWARRTTPELTAAIFLDLPSEREGAEPLRIASVRDPAGEPRAYALFSRKMRWADNGAPQGVVSVREAVALDAAAARALWTFLGDLDLMVKVESPMLAPDDPLLTLLVDTRAVAARTVDNVWVRLVDVPGALAGRTYAGSADVVLEVSDAILPANQGRWRLRARTTPGDSEVEPTSDPADVVLDVRELGTAYLGGVSLGSLRAAGLVHERTRGAVDAASTALGWPDAPLCSWVF